MYAIRFISESNQSNNNTVNAVDHGSNTVFCIVISPNIRVCHIRDVIGIMISQEEY